MEEKQCPSLVLGVYGLSQSCYEPLQEAIGPTVSFKGLKMDTEKDDVAGDVFIHESKDPHVRSLALAEFLRRHSGRSDHVALVFCKTEQEIEILAAQNRKSFFTIIVGIDPDCNDLLDVSIDDESKERLSASCKTLIAAVMRFKEAFSVTRYYEKQRLHDKEALFCAIEELLLSYCR